MLIDGAESAEDEQTTPKVGNTGEAEETGSAGRYPSSESNPARLTQPCPPIAWLPRSNFKTETLARTVSSH